MLDLHLNVAMVAFLVFAVSTQFFPNVLKNVKVPIVREVVEMLNNNRKGFVYNSLVVALVAGVSSYLAMRLCGSNDSCVTRLSNLAGAIKNRAVATSQ